MPNEQRMRMQIKCEIALKIGRTYAKEKLYVGTNRKDWLRLSRFISLIGAWKYWLRFICVARIAQERIENVRNLSKRVGM